MSQPCPPHAAGLGRDWVSTTLWSTDWIQPMDWPAPSYPVHKAKRLNTSDLELLGALERARPEGGLPQLACPAPPPALARSATSVSCWQIPANVLAPLAGCNCLDGLIWRTVCRLSGAGQVNFWLHKLHNLFFKLFIQEIKLHFPICAKTSLVHLGPKLEYLLPNNASVIWTIFGFAKFARKGLHILFLQPMWIDLFYFCRMLSLHYTRIKGVLRMQNKGRDKIYFLYYDGF